VTRIAAIVEGKHVVGSASEGSAVEVIFDGTPFYAEKGGQVGDTGAGAAPSGRLKINDTFSVDDVIVHRCVVKEGVVAVGDTVELEVDRARRSDVMRHHTATHLLHSALRRTLGGHVVQSGSYVGPDKLRFDFTHHAALDGETLLKVENLVNELVMEDLPVGVEETTYEAARGRGVIALFGEKYGDTVRAVTIGDFSAELCGGTHVARTGQIGLVKITDERAVGSNLRRIEAVAGGRAGEYVREKLESLSKAASELDVAPDDLPAAVRKLKKEKGELEKKIHSHDRARAEREAEIIAAKAENAAGTRLMFHVTKDFDMEQILAIFDTIKSRFESCAVLIGSHAGGKALLFIGFSDDLVERGMDAGSVIRVIAGIAGGGGGGSARMAQAGGKNPARLPEAVERGRAMIMDKLRRDG
ncbi:MAG: alanine--tRNA ligase-related protein, partial [bacterium]